MILKFISKAAVFVVTKAEVPLRECVFYYRNIYCNDSVYVFIKQRFQYKYCRFTFTLEARR